MDNLQHYIEQTTALKKFEVDELLFAEFKCPIQDEKSRIWWHNNFFAFVVSGETQLQTARNTYILRAGDCAFAKRGSVIIHSQLKDDFCELLVFLPDGFIKSIVDKHKLSLTASQNGLAEDTIIPLAKDTLLSTYFQSLLLYFSLPASPPKKAIKLKFEELLINLLSGRSHPQLQSYFYKVCSTSKPSVKAVMEANFTQNLSLSEYAQLCARSLSSFKTEFKSLYQTTPGKWLLKKRLQHSRYLMETTKDTISEIAYSCGFENVSHFSRVFRKEFGTPPSKITTKNR